MFVGPIFLVARHGQGVELAEGEFTELATVPVSASEPNGISVNELLLERDCATGRTPWIL